MISRDVGGEAIQSWSVPSPLTEEQRFIGLVSYYWRVIICFATIAQPLLKLAEMRWMFEWTSPAKKPFWNKSGGSCL